MDDVSKVDRRRNYLRHSKTAARLPFQSLISPNSKFFRVGIRDRYTLRSSVALLTMPYSTIVSIHFHSVYLWKNLVEAVHSRDFGVAQGKN